MRALMRSLDLETTGVILRDMVTASAGGGAFWNPHMAAVLQGPIRERRVINQQPRCHHEGTGEEGSGVRMP